MCNKPWGRQRQSNTTEQSTIGGGKFEHNPTSLESGVLQRIGRFCHSFQFPADQYSFQFQTKGSKAGQVNYSAKISSINSINDKRDRRSRRKHADHRANAHEAAEFVTEGLRDKDGIASVDGRDMTSVP